MLIHNLILFSRIFFIYITALIVFAYQCIKTKQYAKQIFPKAKAKLFQTLLVISNN